MSAADAVSKKAVPNLREEPEPDSALLWNGRDELDEKRRSLGRTTIISKNWNASLESWRSISSRRKAGAVPKLLPAGWKSRSKRTVFGASRGMGATSRSEQPGSFRVTERETKMERSSSKGTRPKRFGTGRPRRRENSGGNFRGFLSLKKG